MRRLIGRVLWWFLDAARPEAPLVLLARYIASESARGGKVKLRWKAAEQEHPPAHEPPA